MRFLLDMGISPDTGLYLKKLGHDAGHLIDEGLEKASDFQIMEKAMNERRIIPPVSE